VPEGDLLNTSSSQKAMFVVGLYLEYPHLEMWIFEENFRERDTLGEKTKELEQIWC